MTMIDETPIPCPECTHPHGEHRLSTCLDCGHTGAVHKRQVNADATMLICAGTEGCQCAVDFPEVYECPAEGCPCEQQPVAYCPVERVPLADCTCNLAPDPRPCPSACGHLLVEHGYRNPDEAHDDAWVGCGTQEMDCRCELPASTQLPMKAARR
jgi:hypothetical protein